MAEAPDKVTSFLNDLLDSCNKLGLEMEVVRSHEQYLAGKFTEYIEKALVEKDKIREVIENLLRDVNSSLNDTCQAKNSSIHGVEDGADTELVVDSDLLHMSYYRESRHNAFLFLSNIIDRFDVNADLDDNVDRIMIPWLLHKVMPLLIQELNDANKRPHEAFLASKCIRSLLKNFPEIIAMSNHASILRALQRAIKVGHMNHAHLERHCDKAISLISVG